MTDKAKRRRKAQKVRDPIGAEDLRTMASTLGVGLEEFSPSHYRVFGRYTVDYWPTTGHTCMHDVRCTGCRAPIAARLQHQLHKGAWKDAVGVISIALFGYADAKA